MHADLSVDIDAAQQQRFEDRTGIVVDNVSPVRTSAPISSQKVVGAPWIGAIKLGDHAAGK
jgi:hypothetical protein